MTVLEYVQASITELHGAMIGDVKDLSREQLTWKPAPKANPIGFLFWHLMRTEDNMINNLQGLPSVWETGKWYEKLGLDVKAQGTGFTEPDVDKVAALPIADVIAYAERVGQRTADYLKSIDERRLDVAPNPARPNWTIGMMLRNFIVSHGWWHLGEIRYIKGLQGMPYSR
jgi:hypothetical protein